MNTNANFKSGFVSLIGRPNVGKSTLMNRLIGQKIAITSNKPQTTRHRIQTVYTDERGQIVFLDTPGIHKAKNKLGEYMVNVAERTLKEVDVVLWLVEPTTFIGAGEQHIAAQLKTIKTPVVLVINKVDTVKKEEILKFIDAYKEYEFFDDNLHGFVDLFLMFEDDIIVVDYKLKNINKPEYKDQLKTYKDYLEKIFKKRCRTYLISLMDGVIEEIQHE